MEGGIQTFADKLHESLVDMDVNILSKTPCRAIDFNDNGTVTLTTDDEDIVCDHLVSTVSAGVLSSVLPQSLHPLKDILSEISSVSVGLVNLEYKGNVIKDSGFGVLLPSSEPVNVLGIIYDSCVFPQHDRKDGEHTRLTVSNKDSMHISAFQYSSLSWAVVEQGASFWGILRGDPLTLSLCHCH